MRWITGLALLLTACAGVSNNEVPTGKHLQAVYEHPGGEEMRYLVWLPDGYGDDRGLSIH